MDTVVTASRSAQPAIAVPAALEALQSLGKAIAGTGISPTLATLINVRVSQINGCAVCLEGHLREGREHDPNPDRLFLLPAWRETPYFTSAERAVLALAEDVTLLAGKAEAVTDEVWNAAAAHFSEQELAGIVLQIASINVWNRLNAATRQQAGVHSW